MQSEDNSVMKSDITAQAEEIYNKTMDLLKDKGCEGVVNESRVADYAVLTARWKQCEEEITKHGYLAPHPVTRFPNVSPLVDISFRYLKQARIVWDEIRQTVQKQTGVWL